MQHLYRYRMNICIHKGLKFIAICVFNIFGINCGKGVKIYSLTIEEVHKKINTIRFTDNEVNFDVTYLMVTKNPQNVLNVFLPILITFICDIKIEVNNV